MCTLREAFIAKYPKYETILSYYDGELDWGTITKIGLINMVNAMQEKVSVSSARQYCAKLKSVLNMYSEEYDLPKDYAKILSLKNEKAVNTWIDDEELELLCDYDPDSEIEKFVLQDFLIGAYTGMRHSDYVDITESNIVDGMIMYVSKKTHIQATIPCKPMILKLIQNKIDMELSDVSFNEAIRRICRKAGINKKVKVFKAGKNIEGEKWEFISSHTARRSFATNLYLRGADLYSISKLMGHSSVTMTENYICCGIRNLSEQVLAYFK